MSVKSIIDVYFSYVLRRTDIYCEWKLFYNLFTL